MTETIEIMTMKLKSLRTLRDESEYGAAAHFDALALLIQDYETRHYAIPRAAPLDVVKFVMASNN
jgi:HTH-type transcriptional regulator/antitoxin HigA